MLSASYDVDIAKKYSIKAAVLLNKLIYLQRYTPREDGFCWRSASELHDELGMSRKEQEKAIKILENAGILETKNTYIMGTQKKCKHFKISEQFINPEIDKSDFYQRDKSEVYQRDKSDFDQRGIPTLNNNHTYNNQTEYIDTEMRHKYGEYKNVLLTDTDLEKLKNEFPTDWEQRIERLSEYIEIKHPKYKNHLAVIRSWARKDKKQSFAGGKSQLDALESMLGGDVNG